jgi:hypothetical protein
VANESPRKGRVIVLMSLYCRLQVTHTVTAGVVAAGGTERSGSQTLCFTDSTLIHV